MNKRVSIYIAVVTATSLAVSFGVYRSDVAVSAGTLRAAIVFAALATFAQILGHQLARGAKGSVAFIPHLAIIVLAPNWVAVAAVCATALVSELTWRRSAPKALFNISQHALAASAAVVAFRAAGGTPLLEKTSFGIVPFFAALSAFTLANSLAVSGAIAFSEGRRVGAVWRDNTIRSLPFDLLSLPVVYAFAWVYVNGGPTGVALLAVPVLGVRQLYITNWQLERTNQELLELMVAAIEARDPYTSGHSRRVSQYSKIIARAIGLGAREIDRVGVAALLHDVGKIHEVFAPILRKPDRLSPEEWEIMKTHPIKSAELVEHVSQLKDVVLTLRHHHENWDGSGYPDGIAGEEIPLYARVIMFADTIDAMTTDRPYRAALDEGAVRAELDRMRGRQFDPRICDLLLASPHFSQLFEQRKPMLTPRRSVLPLNRDARSRASARA